MNIVNIKQSELKKITMFLIEHKIILHPEISPNGLPDFTGFEGRNFILLLDRNILVKILRLINNSELKDQFSLQLVSSLLVWTYFNNISISSGLALIEYSHFHNDNKEASEENNIFKEIFKQYDISTWLNLAMGRQNIIQPLRIAKKKDYEFNIESDHFKMHYLEMLKISQLYFDQNKTLVEKFEELHNWIFSNILICKYTTFYSAMVFGNRSKIFRNQNYNIEQINKICKNQAWDLTYLSFWSTQYYHESTTTDTVLFATNDKELKELFILTHKESLNIYTDIFGTNQGKEIIKSLERIYIPRAKPNIETQELDRMIIEEKNNLTDIIGNTPPNHV